ncbi:MAG: serine/threonine-protein kinase [Acidobacteriota bacterium]
MKESLWANTTISHYRIVSKLGAGGMGEVYLAEDATLSRKVAIKLLHPESVTDEQAKKRLIREAKAAATLDHPNVCAVHEVGEEDGRSFIVMQYVEGETLADRIHRRQLELSESLDIAVQVADALTEAHSQGIIHRDIKPQNIMITARGQVKVMDFGLARVVKERSLTVSEAETESLLTEPGMIVGTVPYMSPEQVRGETLDSRSDMFSFGAVLYEMVSGRQPFATESAAATFSAILTHHQQPLARYSTEVPAELERIVSKALHKDREERYQSARDLLIDLRSLKHHLEFQKELVRSKQAETTDAVSTSMTGGLAVATANEPAIQTGQIAAVSTRSNIISLIGKVNQHKRIALLTLLILIVAAVAIFTYFPRTHALTDKDTVLLADFVNTTGEPVFDGGTLKQGLAVQLQQSPFLNLFPDARVQQALGLMNKLPDERVTREVGREIALRQRLKAVITGTIAKFDRNYSLTLEAINSQTGETIALTQVETEGKDQVLKALSQAATQLREKLGESLSSIQRFDKPLEEATTSKLEAFQAYALGYELSISGRLMEAIPIFERAVEIDPDFATAYSMLSIMHGATGRLRLVAEYAERAYALRDRVGEYEKLRITSRYHGLVTGDEAKRIEVLMLQKRMYPREWTGPSDLAGAYNRIGQFDQAIAEARESIPLNPNFYAPHRSLGLALLRLNRFAEAKEVLAQALQQKLDTTDYHSLLYQIAFIHGDTAGMQQQIDWVSGKPEEYVAFDWQTGSTAFAGQWRRAQELSRRAVDLASRSDRKEVAARYEAEQALRGAVVQSPGFSLPLQGQQPEGCTLNITRALSLERNRVSLTRSALALALCADAAQAQPLVDELVQRYPKDTLINGLWLPAIRAAMELQRGNPSQAIQSLEATSRYEAAAEFWPQYLRGQAYLRLNLGNEAAAEFQKILDHRGQAPLSPLYPLAQMGLARAAALTREIDKSRKAYEAFFALWKEADNGIPIVVEAMKEYQNLK